MNKSIQFNFRRSLARRTFLRGAGVAVGLPLLNAMQPAFAKEATSDSKSNSPKRFVAMTLGLGLHASNLNPSEPGKNYKPSRYLKSLMDVREKFTVISGSSHPGVNGGHRAESSILTANPAGASGDGKNSISIDQLMAKHFGDQTRFPSLVLSSNGSSSPSYTESGAMIPAQDSPSRLYTQLFVEEDKQQRELAVKRIREGRSIMDLVAEDAKNLARELGTGDRQRLESYFTSVREMEKRLAASEEWNNRPKPKVKAVRPRDIRDSRDFIGKQKLMSDMVRLAIETDSTRFITYHLGGSGGVVPLDGVEEGYHTLSHHGLDDEKLDQLAIIETEIIRVWGDFIRQLSEARENGQSLLDQTSILLTSNLGNASNHSNRNMPVLFAGGGFKHGQHLAFDQKKNYPLPNLFLSILQHQGLEIDKFATSTGTFNGLD